MNLFPIDIKKSIIVLVFFIGGCSTQAQLTFIDNVDGKMYFGQTPSATSSTVQATALIGTTQYSGPWVYSAQGGGTSVGFTGYSGSAFSGVKTASLLGAANSIGMSTSAQGNGLLNMTGADGSFIKCAFDYNTTSKSGIGKCQRNDNRLYDLTVVTGASDQSNGVTTTAVIPTSTPVKATPSPRDPNSVSWNQKSVESANRGDWVEAIRTSSVAINIDPKYAEAYVNRCRAYIGYGDLTEANKDCAEVLKLEPTNMIAVNNLAVISLKQGNETIALVGLEKACLGGFQLSCDNFKKIKGYAPNDTTDLVKQRNEEALKAFNQKNWGSVIALTSEVIKFAPNNADAYITRSGAYANLGNLDDALVDIDKGVKLNPNDPIAYNNRGYIYELKKNKSQAILQYEIACSLKSELGCRNLKLIKQN